MRQLPALGPVPIATPRGLDGRAYRLAKLRRKDAARRAAGQVGAWVQHLRGRAACGANDAFLVDDDDTGEVVFDDAVENRLRIEPLVMRDQDQDSPEVNLPDESEERKACKGRLHGRRGREDGPHPLDREGGNLDRYRGKSEKAEQIAPADPLEEEEQKRNHNHADERNEDAGRSQRTPLSYTLRAQRLKQRARDRPVERHGEEVAELRRRRTDNDLLPGDALSRNVAAEHI